MTTWQYDWDALISDLRRCAEAGGREALVRAVIARTSGGRRLLGSRLFVYPVSIVDRIQVGRRLYGDKLVLEERRAPLHSVLSTDRVREFMIDWPDYPDMSKTGFGQISYRHFLPTGLIGNAYPFWRVSIATPSAPPEQLPEGPFIGGELPFYRSVDEALADWLGNPVVSYGGVAHYEVQAVLSDYCLGELSYSQRHLLVTISQVSDGSDSAGLLLGMRFKYVEGGKAWSTAPADVGNKEVDFDHDISELDLVLTAEQDTLLDEYSETVHISTRGRRMLPEGRLGAALEVRNQVRTGEGIEQEFKRWVDPKSTEKVDEVAKTVIAFANTRGGRVLIGVTDSGEIVGIERELARRFRQRAAKFDEAEEAYGGELTAKLRDRIVGDVPFRFSFVRVSGHRLAIIEVDRYSGDFPPYLLGSDETFVRRGANNMRPRPDELRALATPSETS